MAIKRVRALMALAMGILLTIITALSIIVLGVPYKLLFDWWLGRLVPSPLEKFPKWWLWTLMRVCLQGILGLRFQITRWVKVDGTVVVEGNHPSTLGLIVFFYFVTHHIAPRVLVVLKREHLWNIFIGPPLWILGSGIFINRDDRDAAIRTIKESVAKRSRFRRAIVILSDRHRPTRERIDDARARFVKILGEAPQELHVLFPDRGGTFTIREATDFRLPLIDLTIGMSVYEESIRDLPFVCGETWSMDAEDVSGIAPHDLNAFGLWIARRWMFFKNPFIARRRRPNP
ncbi:MAG: hypothetical protein Q8R07_00775 [Candidatus Uhrbacteria bacterium]|nr:hypothetical protein [Candidatus Uhrbacteria bacterium]